MTAAQKVAVEGHGAGLSAAIVAASEAYRSRRFAPAAPAAGPSGAERMRQLKSLLDDGLISQEEFEMKRRKLLEEI